MILRVMILKCSERVANGNKVPIQHPNQLNDHEYPAVQSYSFFYLQYCDGINILNPLRTYMLDGSLIFAWYAVPEML